MKVKDVMTKNVVSVKPDASMMDVARQMELANVGTVMVVDGNKIDGMISDRSIVTRVLAKGEGPRQMPVRNVMTRNVITCNENEDIESAARQLGQNKIRRMPVMNDSNELVRIVSVADIAMEMRSSLDALFDEVTKACK